MPAINPQVLDMDGCGDVDRALGHRWTSTSVSVSTAYGAVAGYGIQNAATATRYFDPIEWPIIGFHLNIRGATDPSSGPEIWLREGEIVKAKVKFPQTGSVQFYDSAGTLQAETAAGTWQLQTWFYFEIRMLVSNSTEMEIRLFQNVDLDNPDLKIPVGSFIDTLNAAGGGTAVVNNVSFRCIGAGNIHWIDDWYLMNGSLFTVGLGGIQVVGRTVDSDELAEWTRSAGGTNVSCVQEIPFSATSFLTATAEGNQDLYGTADDAIEIEEVYAVRTIGKLKRTGETPVAVEFLADDGDQVLNGDTQHLTTTALVRAEIFQAPAYADIWDRDAVNASDFGIERVAP